MFVFNRIVIFKDSRVFYKTVLVYNTVDQGGVSVKTGLKYLLAIIASLLFMVAALFTCLQAGINDRDYFEQKYEALDVGYDIGMSNADVTAALMRLIDYMEGRVPDIAIKVTVDGRQVDMFNQRETAHMADVKNLYQAWRTIRNIALIFSINIILVLVKLLGKEAFYILAKGFLLAFAGFIIIAGLLAIWVLADFNSFWTSFHLLFFTNDLWLLDPATSRMINICPLQLFYDIVVRMGAAFGISIALPAVAGIIYLAVRKRRERQGAI